MAKEQNSQVRCLRCDEIFIIANSLLSLEICGDRVLKNLLAIGSYGKVCSDTYFDIQRLIAHFCAILYKQCTKT